MKILGIVAEYNPFHKGHQMHIQTAKRETGADAAVCVMSGNFVQRGEPAVFDKFIRTEHALCGGADLVIEMPAYFSQKSAEGFAKAGVDLFRSTGVVDFISFGSECGDIRLLKNTADILLCESDLFKNELAKQLKEGKSYAAARQAAVKLENESAAEVLSAPNNILAVEYLKSMSGSGITPHTIKRCGDYLSESLDTVYPSSSALRRAIVEGKDVSEFMPYDFKNPKCVGMKDFEQMILYSLLKADKIPPDCGDGVWERIKKADKSSLENLLQSAKCKRHTLARIKRAIINNLIGNFLPDDLPPSYLRILGMNKTGERVLRQMKDKAVLPIIVKPSKYKSDDPLWELENRATDIYMLASGNKKSGQNVLTPPVITGR